MILNIEGKDYELNVGIGFIKKLDDKYYINDNNIKFGTGLNYLLTNLKLYNAVVLAEGIALAAGISQEKAEAYIDKLSMDELKQVYADFFHLLKTTPSTALQIEEAERELKKKDELTEAFMNLLKPKKSQTRKSNTNK